MKITKLQLGLMIYFIIRAFVFFIYGDFHLSITSVFLGTFIGICILFIFRFLFRKIKLKDTNPFKILFLPLLLFLFVTLFHRLITFINYNYLSSYPLFIIGISILLVVLFLIKSKVHVLYKSTEICFFISILMYVISLCSLVSLTDVNSIITNIKVNNTTFIDGLFYGIKTVLPLFLITNIDHHLEEGDIFKTTIISYVVTNLFIVIKFSLMLGVLSSTLINIYVYPFVNVLKNISFYDFIDHMESLLSFEYLFDGFILLFSISFYIKDILVFIKKKAIPKMR